MLLINFDLIKGLNKLNFPTPNNLGVLWNLGFSIFILFFAQIIYGLFLSIYVDVNLLKCWVSNFSINKNSKYFRRSISNSSNNNSKRNPNKRNPKPNYVSSVSLVGYINSKGKMVFLHYEDRIMDFKFFFMTMPLDKGLFDNIRGNPLTNFPSNSCLVKPDLNSYNQFILQISIVGFLDEKGAWCYFKREDRIIIGFTISDRRIFHFPNLFKEVKPDKISLPCLTYPSNIKSINFSSKHSEHIIEVLVIGTLYEGDFRVFRNKRNLISLGCFKISGIPYYFLTNFYRLRGNKDLLNIRLESVSYIKQRLSLNSLLETKFDFLVLAFVVSGHSKVGSSVILTHSERVDVQVVLTSELIVSSFKRPSDFSIYSIKNYGGIKRRSKDKKD